jgi:hypothetical protein
VAGRDEVDLGGSVTGQERLAAQDGFRGGRRQVDLTVAQQSQDTLMVGLSCAFMPAGVQRMIDRDQG